MLSKAEETDLQLHWRDKYVFLFHVFWLQEDRLLVLWSSISHFLSTGSYPIWASSFISHLFIWHLNNSSIQEYKSVLWYADSYPVISSAHMVKSFRKAWKKIIWDVSVALTLSSKVQPCKKHQSMANSFRFFQIKSLNVALLQS